LTGQSDWRTPRAEDNLGEDSAIDSGGHQQHHPIHLRQGSSRGDTYSPIVSTKNCIRSARPDDWQNGLRLAPDGKGGGASSVDQQVASSGRVLETEESVLLPDGQHTCISIKFPICDAAGKPYPVGAISTDITERKRAEASNALLEPSSSRPTGHH